MVWASATMNHSYLFAIVVVVEMLMLTNNETVMRDDDFAIVVVGNGNFVVVVNCLDDYDDVNNSCDMHFVNLKKGRALMLPDVVYDSYLHYCCCSCYYYVVNVFETIFYHHYNHLVYLKIDLMGKKGKKINHLVIDQSIKPISYRFWNIFSKDLNLNDMMLKMY